MRRRLDIAAIIVASPEVLFLHEPTTGLDPAHVKVWDLVNPLVDAGTTVLLTTQYLEEADQLADAVVVLAQGRQSPDELKESFGTSSLRVTTSTTVLKRVRGAVPVRALRGHHLHHERTGNVGPVVLDEVRETLALALDL